MEENNFKCYKCDAVLHKSGYCNRCTWMTCLKCGKEAFKVMLHNDGFPFKFKKYGDSIVLTGNNTIGKIEDDSDRDAEPDIFYTFYECKHCFFNSFKGIYDK